MSQFWKETFDLADALMAIPKLSDLGGRKDCLSKLSEDVSQKIEERADQKSHLVKIIDVCVRHEGELLKFIMIVKEFEKDTDEMKEVEKRAQQLLDAHAPSKRFPEPDSRDKGVVDKLALVIGISEYQHEEAQPKPGEFADLNFADKDAEKFGEILKEKHGYAVDPPLVNEKAGLKQILAAMENLRRKCKAAAERTPNPLVLFFFSGHGWKDTEDRHYLVPHDGRHNQAFSTLLWSRNFDLALKEIEKHTNRLVVFLDTCYAGAIGEESTRPKGMFVPAGLIESVEHRCVVASCVAEAHEKDGHGIFTHYLLNLLQPPMKALEDREEVDVWDLWVALKKQVQAAKEKEEAIQIPWTNLDKETGIILAINDTFKEVRRGKERNYLKALSKCMLFTKIADSGNIVTSLTKFIEEGKRLGPEDPAFFDHFRTDASLYAPEEMSKIDLTADMLLGYWSSRGAQQAGRESYESGRDSSARRDRLASGAASIGIADPGQVSTALTSQSTGSPTPDEKRQGVKKKRLSDADCDYVLEKLMSHTYGKAYTSLDPLLRDVGGVSKQAFYKAWASLKDVDDALRAELTKRFDEKWDDAKEITPEDTLSLRVSR